MARRSSARLRARESTPKRVSLSHDAPTRTPRTAPTKLASLQESEEMPGAFPRSPSPVERDSLTVPDAGTPKDATPIRPSEAEMHPQLHHQTTAKPLDEARHLGFSSMCPQTEPPKRSNKIATLQGTPTKSSNPVVGLKSPEFQFTFRREQSLELSPEAKRLMSDMRQEAARIKEQMIANGEGLESGSIGEEAGRKSTNAKSGKGRFSDVHKSQFQKMDSIAGHASSFRAQPKTLSVATPSMQQSEKSLKRSPSKAGLDKIDPSARQLNRSNSKPNFHQGGLPRSTTLPNLTAKRPAEESTSPAKRVKRTETDDVSANRKPTSDDEQTGAQNHKAPRVSNIDHLSTPTQASLARTASIKSRIPGPFNSPSKVTSSPKLLARSPSKASLFGRPAAHAQGKPEETTTHLLSQSPIRSPVKHSSKMETETTKAPESPLLSRTPLKMSVARPHEAKPEEKPSTPLLSRSPSKIAMPVGQDDSKSPGRSAGKSLLSRLNLLKASPVKSILRSPQRLYSDDPAKVLAGTHLATPPKYTMKGYGKPPATAPAQKHVNFSASTKSRAEHREASSTPSKAPVAKEPVAPQTEPRPSTVKYPSLPNFDDPNTPSPQKRRETVGPSDFTFRAGSQAIIFSQSPFAPANDAAPKRRATIRHVSSDAQSFPPPVSGSKKRKYEFENPITDAPASGTENKENDEMEVDNVRADDEEEHRPSKRSKPSTAPSFGAIKKPTELAQAKTARRPTLGVKPKGAKPAVKDTKEKRPTTISQARLNALSQPKRRA